MTLLESEIIIQLAQNGLNISETARAMYMHRSTVTYHINKIHKTTGKNPLDFYDMCDLISEAKTVYSGGNTPCST